MYEFSEFYFFYQKLNFLKVWTRSDKIWYYLPYKSAFSGVFLVYFNRSQGLGKPYRYETFKILFFFYQNIKSQKVWSRLDAIQGSLPYKNTFFFVFPYIWGRRRVSFGPKFKGTDSSAFQKFCLLQISIILKSFWVIEAQNFAYTKKQVFESGRLRNGKNKSFWEKKFGPETILFWPSLGCRKK